MLIEGELVVIRVAKEFRHRIARVESVNPPRLRVHTGPGEEPYRLLYEGDFVIVDRMVAGPHEPNQS